LINKNLCFYYWLRKKIGKAPALKVANTIERVILVFGREQIDKKIMIAFPRLKKGMK
jgi:hypothetical protein